MGNMKVTMDVRTEHVVMDLLQQEKLPVFISYSFFLLKILLLVQSAVRKRHIKPQLYSA